MRPTGIRRFRVSQQAPDISSMEHRQLADAPPTRLRGAGQRHLHARELVGHLVRRLLQADRRQRAEVGHGRHPHRRAGDLRCQQGGRRCGQAHGGDHGHAYGAAGPVRRPDQEHGSADSAADPAASTARE